MQLKIKKIPTPSTQEINDRIQEMVEMKNEDNQLLKVAIQEIKRLKLEIDFINNYQKMRSLARQWIDYDFEFQLLEIEAEKASVRKNRNALLMFLLAIVAAFFVFQNIFFTASCLSLLLAGYVHLIVLRSEAAAHDNKVDAFNRRFITVNRIDEGVGLNLINTIADHSLIAVSQAVYRNAAKANELKEIETDFMSNILILRWCVMHFKQLPDATKSLEETWEISTPYDFERGWRIANMRYETPR